MAVPTITNVYPSEGHTSGSAMVRILGQGFAPPKAAADYTIAELQNTSPATPTVEVLFGAEASPQVEVVNDSLLYARAPASGLNAESGDGTGTVGITVTNLDDTGAAVPGETATIADAFTYRRVSLVTRSDFARLIRAIITLLRRHVIPEVVLLPHTDYSATPDEIASVKIAQLPSLALVGPRLSENAFYSERSRRNVSGHNAVLQARDAYTADVDFNLYMCTDSVAIGLNLQSAIVSFFKRFPYLEMARDEADASAGTVRYEMEFAPLGGPPSITIPSDNSNIVSAQGAFTIKGFDFVGFAGFDPEQDNVFGITAEADDATICLTTEAI